MPDHEPSPDEFHGGRAVRQLTQVPAGFDAVIGYDKKRGYFVSIGLDDSPDQLVGIGAQDMTAVLVLSVAGLEDEIAKHEAELRHHGIGPIDIDKEPGLREWLTRIGPPAKPAQDH